MNTDRILRLIAAAAVAVGGFVHFRIWQVEYRHGAPPRELFVANAAASAVVVIGLVAAIAVTRIDRWVLVAALLLSAGSLAAFALSRGPGLPTLHGNFKETQLETTRSYFFHVGSAKTILVAEGLAVVSGGLALLRVMRRPTGP